MHFDYGSDLKELYRRAVCFKTDCCWFFTRLSSFPLFQFLKKNFKPFLNFILCCTDTEWGGGGGGGEGEGRNGAGGGGGGGWAWGSVVVVVVAMVGRGEGLVRLHNDVEDADTSERGT